MDLRAMMKEMEDLVHVDFNESQIAETDISESGEVVMALLSRLFVGLKSPLVELATSMELSW